MDKGKIFFLYLKQSLTYLKTVFMSPLSFLLSGINNSNILNFFKTTFIQHPLYSCSSFLLSLYLSHIFPENHCPRLCILYSRLFSLELNVAEDFMSYWLYSSLSITVWWWWVFTATAWPYWLVLSLWTLKKSFTVLQDSPYTSYFPPKVVQWITITHETSKQRLQKVKRQWELNMRHFSLA